MPRGRKKSHKGGHRHFSNEDDIQLEAEKLRKEQEWRKMKGIESDEEEDGKDEAKKTEDGATAVVKKPKEKSVISGQPGELPPSDSDEDSDEDDEDDEPDKPKGVAHLIEIENPNRLKAKPKKVADLAVEEGASSLSRREREELEKQAAKDRYEKLHAAGKTDEARADLARLALIRKQREDAAKKRDDEKKAQDDAKAAAEKKLLEKRKAAS